MERAAYARRAALAAEHIAARRRRMARMRHSCAPYHLSQGFGKFCDAQHFVGNVDIFWAKRNAAMASGAFVGLSQLGDGAVVGREKGFSPVVMGAVGDEIIFYGFIDKAENTRNINTKRTWHAVTALDAAHGTER